MRLIKSKNLNILVLALFTCLTGIFYIVNYPRRQAFVFAALMLLTIGVSILMYKKSKNIVCAALFAILTISFLIKADYVIYTPCWIRQHDVIGFGAGFGQAAFIEYFYEKIRLIDFDPRDYWGFFQPPLHHMIAGLWLRLMNAVCPNYDWACDNVQLLSLFYSSLVSIVSVKILKRVKIEGLGFIVAIAFVALHPCFILLSGSINNDILCILLQLVAMYYFIKWNEAIDNEEEKRMVYIILTALALGLSMMTKLSGILIAPAIGVLLLYRLIISLHNTGNIKETLALYIKEYVIFGLVSIPIGIWSPVRNLIKFSVPLNFTPEVGEPLTDHSVLERLINIKTQTPFTCLIDNGNEYDEFNFFIGMVKTSLVGEYDFSMIKYATPVAWVLYILGFVLLICSAIALIHYALDKNVAVYLRIFISVYAITTMVFYVNLCFSIPNFSSLDFRYIAHLIILAAIASGNYVNRASKIPKYLLSITISLFSISSLLLYLLIGTISWR